MFHDIYKDKKVFISGHTGFKGSWLCFWLLNLGAEVIGFSIDTPSKPSNFEILGLKEHIHHIQGDVCDRKKLLETMQTFSPDFVFHLAAQALVRKSFDDPVSTFETNALGTLNVLECVRFCPSVQVCVMITSDKCYRNLEWSWGYRENDILGGEDPYSASKGCAELIIYSYTHSFFKNNPRISSVRAGNVIGGGDWAADRIIPDAVRAWSQNVPVIIRDPDATRPWQHVLEPLSGYLWLGAKLWEKDSRIIGEPFNFGPDASVNRPVRELLSSMARSWPGVEWEIKRRNINPKTESTLLKLCCDKSLHLLDWRAMLSFEETISLTAEWYRTYYENGAKGMTELTHRQLDYYTLKAKNDKMAWFQ